MADSREAVAQPGPTSPAGAIEYVAVFLGFVLLYTLFFAPALVTGQLLAPGDGANTYVPAVMREWSLWTDLILAGYPAFADPQFLTWYPLRLLGAHYNALVLSAYVIASFCTYGYARLLSGSVCGGLVAAVVYGCGGFMTAHLGHLTIIHAAAWVPLTLWGLELLARDVRWRPAILVASGVALSFLGGHPQPWIYGLLLAGAYAVWRSTILRDGSRIPHWHYLLRCAAAFVIGVAIASIQLLPLIEFSGSTVRQQWTYADFISYSLPLSQWHMFVFPNLLGNVVGYYQWFGKWSLTELACYAGVVPLLLAAIAPFSAQTRRHAWFWLGACLLAVIYMLGDESPFGKLFFHLPVLGHFRASGRAGMVFILGIGVLASITIGGLQRGSLHAVSVRRGLLLGGALLGLFVCPVVFGYGDLVTLAATKGSRMPPLMRNPAVWLPVVFASTGIALCLWLAHSRFWLPRLILPLVVLLDVGSFGWFYEWRVNLANPPNANVPGWESITAESSRDYGRIFPLDGEASPGPARPNVNLIYGLASASGYGPLLPARYAELTGVNPSGSFNRLPTADNGLWPLLGVRWLVTNKSAQMVLGKGCGVTDARATLRVELPAETDLSALSIDSHLACSASLADDTPVIDVFLDDATTAVASVLAGRDSSEWSIDSPASRGKVHHRRGPAADSFAAGGNKGLWFRSRLALPAGSRARSLTLRARLPTGSVIRVRSLAAVDSAGKEASLSLFAGAFGNSDDWRAFAPPQGFSAATEYTAYPGRAWLVGAAEIMDDKSALETIESGETPLRRPFKPLEVALLDEKDAQGLPGLGGWGRAGTVEARRISSDHWTFKTKSDRPALLVVSQNAHPGWRADVNGRPAEVRRADYALQAIALPAGDNEVDLRFRPRSLLVGGTLCAIGLLLLTWFAFPPALRRKASA